MRVGRRQLAALCAGAALAACQPEAPAPKAATAGVPHRIVSLAPSLTELLFTLGVGDRVIGVTRFCDRPAEASQRAAVGDAKQVSLERIAALQPDLILINAAAVDAALRPLGGRFPILLAPTETVGDMLDSIELVGAAIGVAPRARALRAEIEQHIASVRSASAGVSRGRVIVVLEREPYFVAGPGSYLDQLLEILGWQNATAGLDSHWPCISAEALVQLAPDVILDTGFSGTAGSGGADAEVRAYWGRFPSMPAVRAGRVYALESGVILRPGPALREALDRLGELLARAAAR